MLSIVPCFLRNHRYLAIRSHIGNSNPLTLRSSEKILKTPLYLYHPLPLLKIFWYNMTHPFVKYLLDISHEKSTVIAIHPHIEWYTPEISDTKKERSKCEQCWRRTGLTVQREAYKEERNHVNALIV